MRSCAKSVERVWYCEGCIYWLLGKHNVLVLEHSLYDVFLCVYFGGDGCAGISTLGNDAVSDTTLGAGARWGARTGGCGVNYDGNVGWGAIGVIFVLMVFSAGMARLRSVSIYFTTFCVSYTTCSSPRCPLRSHSLVCIENHLFIVGIGPFLNKELKFYFLIWYLWFFVRL